MWMIVGVCMEVFVVVVNWVVNRYVSVKIEESVLFI